jgi:hypothetical protein
MNKNPKQADIQHQKLPAVSVPKSNVNIKLAKNNADINKATLNGFM